MLGLRYVERQEIAMLGAIAGDIAGSLYERQPIARLDGPLFGPGARWTDDTVHTIALADALLRGVDAATSLQTWSKRYPDVGYGGMFLRWLAGDVRAPYGSFGNGSAMRCSPVGWLGTSWEDTLETAARTAAVTHDHPEGIRGAQAVAGAIWLLRGGADKAAVRDRLTRTFGYRLDRGLEAIRPTYRFDATCQGSVPEAIEAFLEADSVEAAIRNAISLGGDADTQACIAGGLAEAHFGLLTDPLRGEVLSRLDPPLRAVAEEFLVRVAA